MLFKSKIANSEKELISGCVAEKEACFKILFEQYYGKMLNVCLRYAKDKDEAKDMLQEGFIRAFRNIRQYNYSGSFEGWLKKIMVNTSLNIIRQNNLINISGYIPENDSLQFELLENSFFEDQVISDLSAAELLGLVQRLPPAYRAVFNLYVTEGLSHKEIAEIMDITESTSRSNLVKARTRLQQFIEADQPKKIHYAGK